MFIWNMLGALILLPALGHFLLKSEQVKVDKTQVEIPLEHLV